MTEELLQAEPTGHSYFVSRLTTRQAHYLWDCSSPVHDDVKFYDNFLAGLEARGEYLNLAQLYLTLKSLYGESNEDAAKASLPSAINSCSRFIKRSGLIRFCCTCSIIGARHASNSASLPGLLTNPRKVK